MEYLLHAKPMIGFIPCRDFDIAREFYEQSLGLDFERDDGVALVFNAGGNMLRIVLSPDFTPQPFTALGWEVKDIHATVATLTERGVQFKDYPFFEQDELGIWKAPNGDQVAWFEDPDGNVLSLSQHR